MAHRNLHHPAIAATPLPALDLPFPARTMLNFVNEGRAATLIGILDGVATVPYVADSTGMTIG